MYIYKYLMGGVKKTEPDFSPWNQMIRGNEHKLKYRKILFKHKKKKNTVRVTEHLHQFPREFVESLSLEILKT